MSTEKQIRAIAKVISLLPLRESTHELLQAALTHRSWINEQGLNLDQEKKAANERLEFLGDAVLGVVIAKELYQRLPQADEGLLSKAKAHLVSALLLAQHARTLELGETVLLGRGEELTGGRQRNSILGDVLEAIIGALFLGEGFEASEKFILQLWQKDIDQTIGAIGKEDAKSLLQEYCQKLGQTIPRYQVENFSGPDHNRHYTVTVDIAGQLYGRGEGSSKKQAEQSAAAQALEVLKQKNPSSPLQATQPGREI